MTSELSLTCGEQVPDTRLRLTSRQLFDLPSLFTFEFIILFSLLPFIVKYSVTSALERCHMKNLTYLQASSKLE